MKNKTPNVSLSDDGTLDTVFTCADCGETLRYSADGMERSEGESIDALEEQAGEEHADECRGYTAETAKALEHATDGGGAHGHMEAACALHWFCSDSHGGQTSDVYAILCELKYHPGRMERGPAADSAHEYIYGMLERKELDPREVLAWIQDKGEET